MYSVSPLEIGGYDTIAGSLLDLIPFSLPSVASFFGYFTPPSIPIPHLPVPSFILDFISKISSLGDVVGVTVRETDIHTVDMLVGQMDVIGRNGEVEEVDIMQEIEIETPVENNIGMELL